MSGAALHPGAQSGSDDDLEGDAITDREGVKWFRPFIRASGSTIWKHMRHDEKKTQVKCDLCPKVFKFSIAGGTSTQRRHLENVHKLNLKEEVTPNTSGQIFFNLKKTCSSNPSAPLKSKSRILHTIKISAGSDQGLKSSFGQNLTSI